MERWLDERAVVAGQCVGGEAGGVEAAGGLEGDQGAYRLGGGLLDDAQEFVSPVDGAPVAAGALRARREMEDQAVRIASGLDVEAAVCGGDGGDLVGSEPGVADPQPDPGTPGAHHVWGGRAVAGWGRVEVFMWVTIPGPHRLRGWFAREQLRGGNGCPGFAPVRWPALEGRAGAAGHRLP